MEMKEITDNRGRKVTVPANTSIMLGLPCYGGQLHAHTRASIALLEHVCAHAGIRFEVMQLTNESLIQRARNTIASTFLTTDHTHLFFLDSDIYCQDPWCVLEMLAEGRDVIGGAYPKKEIDWQMVAHAAKIGDIANIADYGTVYNANLPQGGTEYVHGTMRAEDVPTGFLLIKRQVFERMRDELDIWYNYDGSEGKHYSFFPCWIEDLPNGKRTLLSEDWGFCRQWQKLGGQVWLDMRPRLGHIGPYMFIGPSMLDWWERMQREKRNG